MNWLALLFLAGSGVIHAQSTPTMIQVVNQSLLPNNTSCNGSCFISAGGTYRLNLPNGTQAGNAIILAFTVQGSFGNGSITDDQGNTWTQAGTPAIDAANNQYAYIYYALNVAAGTRTLTIHAPTANNITAFQPVAAEFYNVATVGAADGYSTGSGNSAAASTGSISPTASGDLLFHYVFRSVNPVNTGFTAGSNWKLLAQDTLDGDATQYTVYNSTASITPAMTMSNAVSYVSAALALKGASAGSPAPAVIQVMKVLHETFVKTSSSGAKTYTLGVPCSGANLVVAMVGGNYHWLMNSMSDSNGNTWKNTGPQFNNGANGWNEGVQTWYINNPSCSDNTTVNATFNDTTQGHGGIFFYVISGAAASPFDADATAWGNQGGAGTLNDAAIITPKVANTLLVCAMPVYYNTVGGFITKDAAGGTVPGGLLDATTFSGESVSGPEPVDQNNGWAHAYLANTSQIHITWTQFYSSTGFAGWATRCNTWAGAAGSPPPPNTCDLNGDNVVNGTDVQIAINQALGVATCGSADLQRTGRCDVVDVQRVVNATLGQACRVGP